MMHILHVVPSYIPAHRYGGPIYSVHGLCKGLVERGHDVHVFTTNVDGDKDSDVPLETPVDIDGVKVWYYPSRFMRRLYRSPDMKDAVGGKVGDFDLLHLHSVFLWPTWVAARAAKSAGIPYVIAPRGMLVKELIRRKSYFLKTAWINLIERRNLEEAAAIHVTSKAEGEDVAGFGFKLKKVVMVTNGVDIATRYPAEDGVTPYIREIIGKGPYLLFLGRINWKKGLDRLVPAMSYVPDIRLIVAGNDEENYKAKLQRLIGEHGLKDRIIFCGPVYDLDKIMLFRNAMAFVLPSYSENFGIAVLEAMAASCPVVVTPEVGAAEIVNEAGAGIVVSGKPIELGRGIAGLLSSGPQRLKEMGDRGRKIVEEKYTWAAVAGQMEEVYRSIVK